MSKTITLSLPNNFKEQKPDSIYPKGFYFDHKEDENGKSIQESNKMTMQVDQFSQFVAPVLTHCFASWEGTQKTAKAITEHYALSLDIDDGMSIIDFMQIDDFKNLRYYIYTSKSHQIVKGKQAARDRFHVLFPFSDPINHDEFLKLLDTFAIVTAGIGIGNDNIHDNNENSIFFPSRQSGKPANKDTYKFIKHETDTDLTIEIATEMVDKNGFVKEIRSRKSNGSRPAFNIDLVDEFSESDVISASKKIGKMAQEEEWDYKQIVDLGFSLADMQIKGLIDQETAITALFNVAEWKGIGREMVANKYESSLLNSVHSITLSSFLKHAQDAGYKKHIITYAPSLKAGNEFLYKNINKVIEVIDEASKDNTNNANFVQGKLADHRKTMGTQFSFNNNKLYQIAIEYNHETGNYWMHNYKNIPPTPLKSLVLALKKKVEISKEMIPSVTEALASFIVSVFPHVSNTDLISAEYDSDFNKLWEKDNEPEIKRSTTSYNCRNCYNTWTGTDKQKDADQIYEMIARVFNNKENLYFYLKWLALFTYVDKIGTTPVMVFTSKARGTGKSMLLTDLPKRIFNSDVQTSYSNGEFNKYIKSKLVSLSEVGGDGMTFNVAAKMIKKTTGSKSTLLRELHKDGRMIPSRPFFTIDSNEEAPIRLFDHTDQGNNQFFVVKLGESLVERYPDWISKTLEETVFSGRYNEKIAAFRELYLEPLIPVLKAEKGERFGLKVPITEDLKSLLGKSISIGDRKSILALNDLRQATVIADTLQIKDTTTTLRYSITNQLLTQYKKTLDDGFLSNSLSRLFFAEADKIAKVGIADRLKKLDILIEPKQKSINGKTNRGWSVDIEKLNYFVNQIDPSLLA